MKETKGIYNETFGKVDWTCPGCRKLNLSKTTFVRGTHVFKCSKCLVKRKVIVFTKDTNVNLWDRKEE